MKKLTIEEHREMGNALKAFRNEHLVHYAVLIQNTTPKISPQSRAVRKALNAIDELRSVMDSMAYEDHGDAPVGIYYGTEEKKGARAK